MKKLLIIIPILFIAYFFYPNHESAKKIKRSKDPITSKSQIEKIIDHEKTIKKLKVIVKEEKDIDFKQELLSNITNQTQCILDKSCMSSSDDRFYDETIDPAHTILRKYLEILNSYSLKSPDALSEINDELLLTILETTNTKNIFLSLNLLLRKGRRSFAKTRDVSKAFKGENAKNYTKIITHQVFTNQPEFREFSQKIILTYISADPHTSSVVLEVLADKNIDSEFSKTLLPYICDKAQQFNGESKSIYLYNYKKMNDFFNPKSDC